MSYLPLGWTESRLKAATVDDLRSVPEDRLHELDVDIIDDIYAKIVVRNAQRFRARDLRGMAKGLAPLPRKSFFDDTPTDDPVVQLMEEAGLDDYGFVAFRVDDFSNEERWEKWQEEYGKAISAAFAKMSGGKRVEDKFLTSLLDEDVLGNAGLPQIKDMFHILKDNGDIPPGLDISMCLAVDAEATESLLNPVLGVDPWVYAIDVNFNFDNDLNDVAVDEYPGFFRVAISSLAPELYPMLAGPRMSPQELWPMAKPIWKSAF